MRRLTWLLLCAAGCGRQDAQSARSYLPLDKDRISVLAESGGRKHAIEVQADEHGAGYWSLIFPDTSAGKMSWLIHQNEQGLQLAGISVGAGATLIQPPLLLLPASLVEGVSWTSEGKGPPAGPSAAPAVFWVEGAAPAVPLSIGGKNYRTRYITVTIAPGKGIPGVKYLVHVAPGVGIVRFLGGTDNAGKNPDWPADSWDLVEIQKKS